MYFLNFPDPVDAVVTEINEYNEPVKKKAKFMRYIKEAEDALGEIPDPVLIPSSPKIKKSSRYDPSHELFLHENQLQDVVNELQTISNNADSAGDKLIKDKVKTLLMKKSLIESLCDRDKDAVYLLSRDVIEFSMETELKELEDNFVKCSDIINYVADYKKVYLQYFSCKFFNQLFFFNFSPG